MLNLDLLKKQLRCSTCGKNVFFEIIQDIECDWGVHDILQCTNCQELFSIDKQCIAFQDIFNLLSDNPDLLSHEEKASYRNNPHV